MCNDNDGCLNAVFTFLFLLVIPIAFCLLVNTESCKGKARALGYQCEYDIWAGCVLIKSDGKKVLLEQLRDFNE